MGNARLRHGGDGQYVLHRQQRRGYLPHYHSVDNTEGTLQVNSYINFKITASENDNCLVLPLQCVRKISKEDGSTIDVVFVKGDRPDNAVETPMLEEEIPDGFWAVPVEIGISDNTNVEIKSGVEEGTEVFTQIQSMQAYG